MRHGLYTCLAAVALLGCLLPLPGAELKPYHVSEVRVTSCEGRQAAWGTVWSGELRYDLPADHPLVWTWLETSLDGGRSWSPSLAQPIGHVGPVASGPDRRVLWILDGGAQRDFTFRIRVDPAPKSFMINKTPVLDLAPVGQGGCPKPIPEEDPYEVLERMLDSGTYKFDISQIGRYRHRLADLELHVRAERGPGLTVGMGESLSPKASTRVKIPLKIRATYLKVGGMEFAVISKNSIRNTVDVVRQEKAAIEQQLGIPASQVMHNWCHQHYQDDGELAIDETVAALRQAREQARPARLAVLPLRTGPGWNYYRSGQSGKNVFTDGPIDDHLTVFLFADRDGKPIGSWIRFTGHGAEAPALSKEMEERWGGRCAFLNGHGGNTNTTQIDAAMGGKYSPKAVVDLILAALPSARFQEVGKLGVAWGWTNYYKVDTQIQCLRLGDWRIPAYNAEPPVEQALVTAALLGPERTMVVGYANGRAGPGGGYYMWGRDDGIPRWQVFEMTQLTVRCANILERMLDR